MISLADQLCGFLFFMIVENFINGAVTKILANTFDKLWIDILLEIQEDLFIYNTKSRKLTLVR